jgi:hypothetical protein
VDRFVGHYANRFDAERRLASRPPLRAALARETFGDAFAHPEFDHGEETPRAEPRRVSALLEGAEVRARRSRSERSAGTPRAAPK